MAAPEVQAHIMTTEQYLDLRNVYLKAHEEDREDRQLTRAIQSIDRCDGLHPQHVRSWVRAIDGWHSEQPDGKSFLLELVKATCAGELLEEVRRLITDGLTTWKELRPKVIDHFLSSCEEIRLQVQLESAKQKVGEAPVAYIRRFRADAARAYSSPRSDSEEERVIGAFLRGFSDRHFAERMFRKGPLKTLANAVTLAFDLEAERERMDQMLRSRGQEPMEVDSATGQSGFEARIDQMFKAIQNLSVQLNRLERRRSTPPRADHAQQQRRQTPGNDRRQPSVRQQPSAPRPASQPPATADTPARESSYQWTKDGKPVCAFCRNVGHKRAECRKRQQQQQRQQQHQPQRKHQRPAPTASGQ